MQGALKEVVLRATSRGGHCSGRGSDGRECELELVKEQGTGQFDIKVAFGIHNNRVSSPSCKGAAQPPMYLISIRGSERVASERSSE